MKEEAGGEKVVEKYISIKDVLAVATDWCPDDDGSVGKTGDLREMLDELEAIPAADVIPRDEAIKAYLKGVEYGMTRTGTAGTMRRRKTDV